jgi:hypothetical protein
LIRPEDVGKRVTLQYFTDDGRRTEAVGLLERAERVDNDVVLCVRKKDDSLVRVPLRRIRYGKVIR